MHFPPSIFFAMNNLICSFSHQRRLYLCIGFRGPRCKRRGQIYGGNQSVFTRREILASNEMSGYEGCVKEEGEAVC
jgi:hypothetical protein